MKNTKIKATTRICLFLAFAILLTGMVSAQAVTIRNDNPLSANNQMDNWLGRIISSFQYNSLKSGTFTIAGQTLGCATTPSEIVKFKNGDTATIGSGLSTPAAFVDFFRGSPNDGAYSTHTTDSRQFISEKYATKNSPQSWTCDAGAYWNSDCYVDVYTCPQAACYADSDCGSGKVCDKSVSGLSSAINNGGYCKTVNTNPTWQTQTYSCSNGVKTNDGLVSYGDNNFCMTQGLIHYHLPGNVDQCLSYVPDACTTITPPAGCTPDNSVAASTCTTSTYPDGCGHNLAGTKTDGTCASVTPPTVNDPSLRVSITPISITDSSGNLLTSDSVVKPGSQIQIKFKVKTNEQLGMFDKQWYRIEAGMIPLETSNLWGFTDTDKFFAISGGPSVKGDSCCETQTNIDGSAILFDTYSTEQTLTVTVNAPDKNIVDQCPDPTNGASKYWDSNSSVYTIYIAVKNGCYKDGYREMDYRVRTINLDVNNNQTKACVGLLPDGQSCSKDIECCSGSCAGLIWKKCSAGDVIPGNGTGVQSKTQPSLPIADWKTASPSMRINTICSVDDNCAPYENLAGGNITYKSQCKQTAEITDQLTSDYKSVCQSSWISKIGKELSLIGSVGCITGIAGTVICSVGTGGICTGPGVAITLAVCGGTALVGTQTLLGCGIWSQPDLSKGACIAVPQSSPFDIGAWLSSIGNYIKITGNPMVDGIIVIVGGLFILMFLLGAAKGKK